MATQVQLRRGTAAQNDSFTGAAGELTFDTTNKRVRIHDGSTAGGFELKTENSSGDTLFADGEKAIFGAGSDLQIYANGGYSYIDETGAQNLNIRTNGANIGIFDTANSQYMGKFTTGGAAELYHNGSAKLATTSTGVDVTGTVTADGLTVDNTGGGSSVVTVSGNDQANIRITLDNNGTGGNEWEFVGGNHGANNADLTIYDKTNTAKRALFSNNGDISFYEDTGTTPKFFWDASAEALGLGSTSPDSGRKLHIEGGDTTVGITLKDTAGSQYGITSDNNVFTIRNDGLASDRLVIDSSGNVGIGTSSPNLHGWTTAVTLNTSSNGGYEIGQSGTKYGAFALQGDGRVQLTNFTANPLTFQTNNTERMRIDSSGNLLVGQSSTTTPGTGNTTTGISLRGADGAIHASRNGNRSLYANRSGTDGPIISVEKDGTEVGSIGTYSGNIFLSDGGRGVAVDGTVIYGTYSNGSAADNAQDLGAPLKRWRDIYVGPSGGVYLGGTGAANRLTDYEEGSWTPVLTTDNADMTIATTNFAFGKYTKIGRFVQLVLNYSISTFTSVGTGGLKITGFPFNPASDGSYPFYGGSVIPSDGFSTNPTTFGLFGTGNTLRFLNGTTTMSASDLDGGTFWVRGTFTYQTT